MSNVRPAVALLIAVVLPGLWLGEVRPQLVSADYDWPGHPDRFYVRSYLPGDCVYYRAIIVSLLEDRDLNLENNLLLGVVGPRGQMALGRHGEWYPKHPLGLALVALPFYAAFGDPGLLLFNLLQVTALDVLIFFLARRYASDAVALGVALLYAFGTILRPMAHNFSPDVLSTLVVVAGALALLERREILAGILLSLAVAVKWTNLAFVPLAAVWTFAIIGKRPTFRFCLAAAPALLALGALNVHMFGSALITPYDRAFTMHGGQPEILESHWDAFDQPFWSSLIEQMVSRDKGLIRSAPPVLLALPGFIWLFRRSRSEAALLAMFVVAQICIFAPYRRWSESTYGHRFLLTVVALSAAPLAALLAGVLSRPRAADAPPAPSSA